MLHESDITKVNNTIRSKLTREAVHHQTPKTLTSARLLFSSRVLTIHLLLILNLHLIRARVHFHHYLSLNGRRLERSQPVMRYGIKLEPKDAHSGGQVSCYR
jgi:hypothetical protein